MSMMVSFVLSFFPRDVLDEILNLIESVSKDFPSYSCSGLRFAVVHKQSRVRDQQNSSFFFFFFFTFLLNLILF